MSRLDLRLTLLIVLTTICTGCVFVPVTTESYDAKCQLVSKHAQLGMEYISGFENCAGDGCTVLLAAIGITAAASAVVSGSIVVVKNVVYWYEKRGHCATALESTQGKPYAQGQSSRIPA